MFLEPVDWMSSAIVGNVQGKLYCPGCNAKLGAFNWAGITNESGLWVTPGFQIHCNRVDTAQPAKPLSQLATLRMPAFGTMSGTAARPQQSTQAVTAAAAVAPDEKTQQPCSGAVSAGGNRFHSLILDCDGVLVDSERASCESLRRAILQVSS